MPSLLKLIFLLLLLAPSLPLHAQGLREAKPWIGIGIEKGPRGVLIKSILKNTPAEKAGLSVGDEIYEVDGQPVTEPEQLIKAVQSKGVGYKLGLSLWQQSKQVKKTLALEVQPDALEMLQNLYVGKPAPVFTLKSIEDGKVMNNESLKGKVVLLEFWATWCPACRAAEPYLSQLAKTRKDLLILGVTGEEEGQVKAFMKSNKYGFPVVIDPEDKANIAFQVSALPTFFLIDSEGIVRQVAIGGGSYIEALVPEIDALLKKKKK